MSKKKVSGETIEFIYENKRRNGTFLGYKMVYSSSAQNLVPLTNGGEPVCRVEPSSRALMEKVKSQ